MIKEIVELEASPHDLHIKCGENTLYNTFNQHIVCLNVSWSHRPLSGYTTAVMRTVTNLCVCVDGTQYEV